MHRGPMPSLSQRADRETRQNRPGHQRYLCQNIMCPAGSFLLDYRNRGYVPEVKRTIIDMSLNASGIRDTARVLHISTDTVLSELIKKEPVLESVNTTLLNTRKGDEITVGIERAGEAEMDELWSFIGKKRSSGGCGTRLITSRVPSLPMSLGVVRMSVFEVERAVGAFGITQYYTDHWGAYTRQLDPEMHRPGKRNTQKIERKHLTLRTRIKRLMRKTICFSKSVQMHDIVIGLFVNRYAFGRVV